MSYTMAVVLIFSCMPIVHPMKKEWWWQQLKKNQAPRGVSHEAGAEDSKFFGGYGDEWRCV